MALDVGAIPDTDAAIGAGAGGGESSGDGRDFSESVDMEAEMDAIMAGETAVDDAAGFEATPAAPFGSKPPAPKPDEPKVETKPETAAAAEPAKPADADAAPGELPPPALAAAEATRLRKGFASLAKQREDVIRRETEAKAIIERSKAFERKAVEFDTLSAQIQSDPLNVILRLAGKTNPADQEAYITQLLDEVIKTEKPPLEREFERYKREQEAKEAAREAAAQKAQADREAAEARAKNEQILTNWHDGNVGYAKANPDKYDLINSLDALEAVHETCVSYLKLHNHVLAPEAAADFLEKKLRTGVENSKFLKAKLAESQAAKPATPAAKPAQSSNGSTAPKHTGTRTLSSVPSGDSTPSAAGYPEDEEARMAAVLNEMKAGNELPESFF